MIQAVLYMTERNSSLLKSHLSGDTESYSWVRILMRGDRVPSTGPTVQCTYSIKEDIFTLGAEVRVLVQYIQLTGRING